MKRLEFLAQTMSTMRSLGVVQWGGIVLGPDPHATHEPISDEERALRIDATLRRRHDILFASTSVKPPFLGVQGRQNGPKSDVPRSHAPGRRHGLSG